MIRRHPAVKMAIPLALGDTVQGWRIAGTVEALFNDIEYAPGRRYAFAPGGRNFKLGEPEAIVGSYAANRLGWTVGSTFHPHHGLTEEAGHEHDETYTVVGEIGRASCRERVSPRV